MAENIWIHPPKGILIWLPKHSLCEWPTSDNSCVPTFPSQLSSSTGWDRSPPNQIHSSHQQHAPREETTIAQICNDISPKYSPNLQKNHSSHPRDWHLNSQWKDSFIRQTGQPLCPFNPHYCCRKQKSIFFIKLISQIIWTLAKVFTKPSY